MKKYFLLISLFACVFLGLGNYSFAENCPDGSVCNSPLMCDCSQPDLNDPNFPSDAWLCNACKSATVSNPSVIESQEGSLLCVKPNTHLNSITNQCVCNDGYKPGTDPCKKCSDPGVCCGISLNTSVPFIGNCIEDTNANVGVGEETGVTGATAFPVLMGSLTKILVTVILILSFVLIVIGGIMIATGNPSGGKKMIMKVVIGIAILGASGVILRLINPNFFG
ncbi:MAG: hypothetical protein WC606_02110 [Candidatus Absconditabacterales bacterium]